MGSQTNELARSSKPTGGSSTNAEDKGHPTSPMNNDRLGDDHSSNQVEIVRGFMMDLGVQENVNLQPPGAVHIGYFSNDTAEEDTNLDINEGTVDLPIVAHLAPDEADMEAMWEERRAARIAQEMEERTRLQEMIQTRDVALVRDADIVVVADEVKEVRSHPGQKNRRKWIMAILLLLLVVGGVAAFLILQDRKDKQVDGPAEALSQSDAPSNAPSFSPVEVDPLVDELRSWIAPTREDLLRFMDPTSPQSQALVWLRDDPITLSPGRRTQTVLERYVLAVLYYSTSGPSWKFDYLSDEDVCTWNNGKPASNYSEYMVAVGVYCVEGGESISTVALVENQLRGQLHWELALLTNLEVVNFGYNSLSGTIPTRIIDLTNLEYFGVYSNALTGPIPSQISELTRLERFYASTNLLTGRLPATFSPYTLRITVGSNSLTGPIPESWGTTMPALELIALYENTLTGSLPSTFGRLSNLVYLTIDSNLLTGPLPATLPAGCSHVFLMNNVFTGSIPSTWGKTSLPNLTMLLIDENSLTGTIPSSLFAPMTHLEYFEADDNYFSGPLPALFPATIKVVYLANNALTGPIPSTWADDLPNLGSLAIDGNSLTGTVPLSLGQITTLDTFFFNSNSLTGSADFLCGGRNWTDLEADCPWPVTCSCCTICFGA